MIKFSITLEGTNALLMHSARLSNPLDPMAKAMKKISGKRAKTDEDHLELARLEHGGSLYFDDEVGPYLPSDNIWRSLLDGGKKHKLGVKVKEGITFTTDVNPLHYKGPRTVAGLWGDENFRHTASVKVGMARVTRTRPMFAQWVTEAEGILDPNILDFDDLKMIADTAGSVIGIGDWRPRYGRYTATVEKKG
jgi:hypothetical protein